MAWGTQQWGSLPWGYTGGCGEITDHLLRALSLLPGQFENSTFLQSMIGAFIGPPGWGTWGIQQLECVFQQLLLDRWLDTAYGEQLDLLGEIVGVARLSPNDTDYLSAIRLQIVINTSKGEPETLIAVAQAITNCQIVHYSEKPPARVLLFIYLLTDGIELLGKLDQAAGAGIAVTVTGSQSATPFGFGPDRDSGGSTHGEKLPYIEGFGETTLSGIGGNLVEVFVP